MDGDTVLANCRNRRLYASRLVDRSGTHGRNSKASALVKPQRVEVVVSRGYPQEVDSLGSQRIDKSFDQGGPDALLDSNCVQRNNFRENDIVRSSNLISREALPLSGDQSRYISRIDGLPMNDNHAFSSPPFVQDHLYPRLIYGLFLSDFHHESLFNLRDIRYFQILKALRAESPPYLRGAS
jgi:hypothetical protein